MSEKPFRQIISKFTPIAKTIANIIGIFAVLGMISFGAATYFALNYFKESGPLQADAMIVIPDGSSLKSIANRLAENNVIKYPEIFSLMIRFSESGKRMKAGQYKFTPKIAPVQVFNKIASGATVTHKITIPEGLMTSQVLQIIADAPYMAGEAPMEIKEGWLLPETYDYKYNDSREKLVRRMKKKLHDVLDEAWENRVDGLPIKSKEEALILASIIEKETGVAHERKEVASVFVNRLRKGMRLQTDPTVIYAITNGEYVLERPLRFKDLEKESPFNTYRNYGLPPAPIANPGKDSIEAALNPAKTPYYYFVADGTGGHKFATTLKQHNRNVREWRKINRKK